MIGKNDRIATPKVYNPEDEWQEFTHL